MHGSTGGDWKRADNTAPRQSPTLHGWGVLGTVKVLLAWENRACQESLFCKIKEHLQGEVYRVVSLCSD